MNNHSEIVTDFRRYFFQIKIYPSYILILLSLIPIIKPSLPALHTLFGNQLGSSISSFFSIWNLLSFLFVCVYYLLSRTKPTILFGCVVLLCISLWASNFLNDSLTIQSIGSIVCNIVIIFGLADIYRKKINDYIHAWYVILTFYMIINSCTMYIYYPKGMYIGGLQLNNSNYYLFALDNVSFLYSMCGLFLGDILCQICIVKRKLHYTMYAFILFAYVYVQAGTAIAILALYVIFYILLLTRASKIFIYPNCLICMFISFSFIVVLNSVGIFQPLLNLIGKDITFSGRTYIWSSAITGLENGHLLFGFGNGSNVVPHILSSYGPRWLIGIGHLHNICMQFFFNGGIIAVLLFILILLTPLLCVPNYKNYRLYNMIVCQFFLTWLAYMFEYRLESYTFWLIPIILFNINYIKGK